MSRNFWAILNKEDREMGEFFGLTFRWTLISCILASSLSFGQTIKASVDTTTVRIGEKILYTLKVEVDSSELVVFPEGQTFAPLEMISMSKMDTIRKNDIFELITTYGLTQFDSGSYTIPRQPVQIGDEIKFSDSLTIRVNAVAVDTTRQGLYDIKPIIEVEKTSSWKWMWYVLGLLVLGGMYFAFRQFAKRRKENDDPLEHLEPFERAKQSLLTIAEATASDHDAIKKYYSHLTFVMKSYLESKVCDHALESTTEELVKKLRLIRDGGKLNISDVLLDNISRVLQRSDLVKFAKSLPEKELRQMDWQTFDLALDQIDQGIPEPSEEELAKDLAYQQELLRLKKRRNKKMAIALSVSLPFLAFGIFMIVKGPKYAWDTVTFDKYKQLLESPDWVVSEYGFPGLTIKTPLVLNRISNPQDQNNDSGQSVSEFTMFKTDELPIVTVKSIQVTDTTKVKLDIEKNHESKLKAWEDQKFKNIFEKTMQFTTPNGAQGIKVFGSAQSSTGKQVNFNLFYFISEKTILQELAMVWPQDNIYAEQIADSIVGSIELIKKEQE